MALQPILNPSVPFTGPIFGGLTEGKMIVIQGQVRVSVKRFSVNLVCGNGNVAFHFNPRFDEGRVVVCNTQQHGRWGAEERAYNMPFQPNIYFEMIINVKSHCYQVSVNGNHFLEYRHRLPFHEVQTLQINGDVSLNCISFAGTNPPPPYTPPAYNVVTATTVGGMFAQPNFVQPSFSGNSGITLSNPAVPFHIAIPGNFTQFRKITIVGNVPFHANRCVSRGGNIMHQLPTFNYQMKLKPIRKHRIYLCIS
ncbi:galectin-4-like isoform X2 [Podarcis lilfordi]|uniref:Galectin n=1 Tax=Podarcis lilfordi TaxID=74358 RepID=A0AA35KNX1_9SAUR|nr:galectin-4-like isoform X2 [Podarcis lilfordi]